jgi:hypothetical protein
VLGITQGKDQYLWRARRTRRALKLLKNAPREMTEVAADFRQIRTRFIDLDQSGS